MTNFKKADHARIMGALHLRKKSLHTERLRFKGIISAPVNHDYIIQSF